jgi:hypothetical protein
MFSCWRTRPPGEIQAAGALAGPRAALDLLQRACCDPFRLVVRCAFWAAPPIVGRPSCWGVLGDKGLGERALQIVIVRTEPHASSASAAEPSDAANDHRRRRHRLRHQPLTGQARRADRACPRAQAGPAGSASATSSPKTTSRPTSAPRAAATSAASPVRSRSRSTRAALLPPASRRCRSSSHTGWRTACTGRSLRPSRSASLRLKGCPSRRRRLTRSGSRGARREAPGYLQASTRERPSRPLVPSNCKRLPVLDQVRASP